MEWIAPSYVCVFAFSFPACDQNELAILEFIHSLVETMDKYFESVCELDVRHAITTLSLHPTTGY